MRLKQVTEDIRLEETILMGMIVSSDFLLSSRNMIDFTFFTSSYTQTVCSWVLDYFDDHQKAPFTMIESIFEAKKDSLDREDISVITKLMDRINSIYTNLEDPNPEFFLKIATPFFEKRELQLKIDKANGLLSQGSVKEAKEVLEETSKISTDTFSPVSPTSSAVVDEAIFSEDTGIVTFPGAVGDMIGPLEKKWMVMLQAPMKRGKTFVLEEIAILSAFQRKRVWVVTMEMNKKNMGKRFIKRVTGCSEEGSGNYVLPVFDCKLNQDGSCVSNNRENKITLIGEDGAYPDYTDPDVIRGLAYKPCTYCRDLGDKRIWDSSVWYKCAKKPEISSRKMLKRIQCFEEMYGDPYIKFVNYPKFSKNINEIFHDYEAYSSRTGWIADVFIIDYLDITAPVKSYAQSRDTIDSNWKTAAGLFDSHNVLGITPAQGSRASIKKALMEEDDTSEDIRKLAHVDVCISMNQTRLEKRKNCYRLGLLAHRHRRFDVNVNACVLWQPQLGQIMLDSALMYIQEEEPAQESEKKKGRKK